MSESNAERLRLSGGAEALARWRNWGPYLADRAWATVREDYSTDANPWNFFPHGSRPLARVPLG